MIIDGKKVASSVREEVKKEVARIYPKPRLLVIQVGEDPASCTYIKSKEKACLEVGIEFYHKKYDANVKQEVLEEEITRFNDDNRISGILIQLPLPKHLDTQRLIDLISPQKDVDGLTTVNLGLLFQNREGIVPCTPLGIVRLLHEYNIEIAGKDVVIVGRSNLVGKPLSMLFLKENATVTICHSKTKNLSDKTKEADILIVAVGKKHLITKEMVKDGAVVIDVGITREDGKLYGDVDFEDVKDKASYITPVPGGVGPMTVSMLLSNFVKTRKE